MIRPTLRRAAAAPHGVPHAAPRAVLSLAALAALACVALPARAQDPDRPLALLQQSHWTARNGLPASGASGVARSGDGYLWLGSSEGLLRFDGVRFVRLDGENTPALRGAPGPSYSRLDDSHPAPARAQSAGLTAPLLVDRDGAMWVAPPDGRLLRYADGAFRVVLPHDPNVGRINEVVRDGAGRLWVVGSLGGRLYALRDGRLQPPDVPPDAPRAGVTAIVRDTGSGIWVGTFDRQLWHVVGRAARRHLEPPGRYAGGIRPLLQTADGTLWVQGRTLYRLRAARWEPLTPAGVPRVLGNAAVELPGGAVVVATRGDGLLRWKDGAVDRLLERDGLSSESVHRVALDAEGSLWAVTDAGLDRLRAAPFTTISARNGLPLAAPATLQLDGRGALWVSSSAVSSVVHALDPSRLLAGRPASVGGVTTPPTEVFHTPFAALPDGGELLLRNDGALAAYRAGRVGPFAPRGLPRARPTLAVTARDGAVWLAFRPHGFGRVRGGAYQAVALPGLERQLVSAAAEDARGRVWVAFADTAVVLALDGDRVARRLDRAAGVAEPLSLLAAGSADAVWGAGAASGALLRIDDGGATAFASPTLAHLLLGATPLVVPHRRELWIASSTGIGRLPYAALDARGAPAPQLFSALDGLTVAKLGRMLFGGAATDRDGRVWFSTPGGLAVVDPARLRPNRAAPRLHIEEVAVAGRLVAYAPGRALEIPPNPDRLDIRFTATALLVPERVRIEYRLVGVDRRWLDGSEPRVASYPNLGPGRYEFRVRGWNEDGEPAERELALAFRVRPAWYEQPWVAALGVLALVALGSGGAIAWQRARARRHEERLRARFEATLEERTRVARELHDTLLSGFTGITLQLQAVQRTVRDAPHRAAERLSQILATADESLRDARLTIWDLRAESAADGALVAALEHAARDAVAGTPIQVQLAVRGAPRPLDATVEATLRRVGREAVLNAARHAAARLVRLELVYGRDVVELTVTDDGRGLAPGDAEAASAAGHWGLSGMRERAARAGGTLRVSGRAGEGTAVHVSLPAARAATLA